MPRRMVSFTPGSFYHIYNRGVNRLPIFLEPRNYPHFLHLLDRHLTHDGAVIAAYCLMPNHYHLLVCNDSGSLSTCMQRLGMAYTNSVNRAYGRVGPLFQGRFKAVAVEEDAHLLQLSRYIHLNPIAAGLVGKPAEWPYSSYAHYLGLKRNSVVQPELVLRFGEFGGSGVDEARTAEAYKQFVEDIPSGTTPPIDPVPFEK